MHSLWIATSWINESLTRVVIGLLGQLQSESFSFNITYPCGISLLSLFWQRFCHLQHFWVHQCSAKYVKYLGKDPSDIRFERIRIWIIFGLKSCPNTNTNNIWFEKITKIQIRMIFGFKKSPEYEYEYKYSASSIRIIFEYQIIRSPLSCPYIS